MNTLRTDSLVHGILLQGSRVVIVESLQKPSCRREVNNAEVTKLSYGREGPD